mmetsp:Transcript_56961/g.152126  ORF Transcript_56961/g.152126 Transcript_56961/m.152126 type:complete len:224 (+) Transcript_56961:276-947(+)
MLRRSFGRRHQAAWAPHTHRMSPLCQHAPGGTLCRCRSAPRPLAHPRTTPSTARRSPPGQTGKRHRPSGLGRPPARAGTKCRSRPYRSGLGGSPRSAFGWRPAAVQGRRARTAHHCRPCPQGTARTRGGPERQVVHRSRRWCTSPSSRCDLAAQRCTQFHRQSPAFPKGRPRIDLGVLRCPEGMWCTSKDCSRPVANHRDTGRIRFRQMTSRLGNTDTKSDRC